MERIWFTADTHFGHKNIIEYDERPFSSVEEMDSKVITNWNNCVKEDDIVYHLGDFALVNFERSKEVFEQLNGHKVLIRGNHDRSTAQCYKLGWDYVNDVGVIKMGTTAVFMVHDPEDWAWFGHRVIHGHTHKASTKRLNYCVSCNLHNYQPVSEKTILKWIHET